jgi:autoinducer 2-degrading protein
MVTRIVKMTFRTEETERFIDIFEKYRVHIRNAQGCLGLKLLHDMDNPSVFFTYSVWEHESSLELYRKSETFGQVWPQVKPLFAEPAQAWTTDLLHDL